MDELSAIDLNALDCNSPKLDEVMDGYQQWQEALDMVNNNNDVLENELSTLNEIKSLAEEGMQSDIDDAKLNKLFGSLELFQKKKTKFARQQCDHLKEQVETILNSNDKEYKKSCCAMLYGLVHYFMNELMRVRSTCQNMPSEINIEGDIHKVQIVYNKCKKY